MKRVDAYLDRAFDAVANASTALGQRVLLGKEVLDRSDSVDLAAPGLISPNGSCRLIQARDRWIAANLPRTADLEDVPALLSETPSTDPWHALTQGAQTRSAADLIARAELLGLALAKVGETPPPATSHESSTTPVEARRGSLRVVDLSSLWAGPLCGAVFAAMGADVVKIESIGRPDTTVQSAPQHDQRLNGGKSKKALALTSAEGRAELATEMARADVLITSGRARGLQTLGLTRERVFAANPSLLWIAITGHGWDSNRIAFGDDAAAAGNLLAWTNDTPSFIGDAIADPLAGVAAASAALDAVASGRGGFIDVALARVAAYVAGRA